MTLKPLVPDEVLYKSLVGKTIKIVNSTNKNQVGKEGILVHETAKLFYLEQNGSTKRILKDTVTFEIMHNSKPLYIDGRLLTTTITHRIKKMR